MRGNYYATPGYCCAFLWVSHCVYVDYRLLSHWLCNHGQSADEKSDLVVYMHHGYIFT